jgi:hypothetical protein
VHVAAAVVIAVVFAFVSPRYQNFFLPNEICDSWRQFHQRFTRKFFVRISPQSQNVTREKLPK